MKQRGFTLIELLVVVSIIGMLASIILASLQGARQKTYETSGRAFEKNMEHALWTNSVLYFDFNEGTGLSTTDKSFINYGKIHGNMTAALWSTDIAPGSNTGSSYAPSGGMKNMSSDTALGLGNGDFTIGLWVKTTVTGANQYIVGQRSATSGYTLGISSGVPAFFIGNGAFTESTCGTQAINDGRWHYLTGEFNRSGGIFRCYVDGHTAGSVAIPAYPGMLDAAPQIGTAPFAPDFTGLIDNVVIYNKGL